MEWVTTACDEGREDVTKDGGHLGRCLRREERMVVVVRRKERRKDGGVMSGCTTQKKVARARGFLTPQSQFRLGCKREEEKKRLLEDLESSSCSSRNFRVPACQTLPKMGQFHATPFHFPHTHQTAHSSGEARLHHHHHQPPPTSILYLGSLLLPFVSLFIVCVS